MWWWFWKSKKKIEEDNKNIKCRYIQGPTGPQGALGPQGITGPQVLQGLIGPKGDTVPQGSRGFPGEIGISQVITIDGTEMVEPNELAEVQDDFEQNIHHLTFYIPKGEKGDKGSQGQTGQTEIIAYAERYLDEKMDFKLETWVDTIVPLTSNGPAFFADYNTEKAIDIRDPGLYQISYYFSATPKNDCKLTTIY